MRKIFSNPKPCFSGLFKHLPKVLCIPSLVLFMAVGKRSTAQLSISSQRTLFSQSWHKGLQSTSVAHCRDKEISQLPRKLLTCRCRGDSQKGMGTCSPVVEGNQKETMFLLGVAVKSVWREFGQCMLPKSELRMFHCKHPHRYTQLFCVKKWSALISFPFSLLTYFYIILIFYETWMTAIHPVGERQCTQHHRDKLMLMVFFSALIWWISLLLS